MMRCDHCQSLLLDHLYGLLDPAEAVAVEEHLAGCPGCAAARDQAARLQGLIAQAAKSEFPEVRFVPEPEPQPAPAAPLAAPALVPAAPSRPAPRRDRLAVWLQWAVAASVLAAVPAAVMLAERGTGRI